jgi:tungstate transport system ATP-binding protein
MRRITLLLPKIGVFNTTVYKNVVYGLSIRNPQRNDITSRAENALDFVGLLQKRNQKALTLSSGETKRLGIARALVIEPEIFFLDEPTASVDQKNTEIIDEIIQKLKREGRSTIIIATHDTAQAERLADRLLFIKHGQISGST